MTQFEKRMHRARTRLEKASPWLRWLFLAVEKARAEGCDWPPYIYAPISRVGPHIPAALIEIGGAEAAEEFAEYTDEEMAVYVAAGLTWASWRMTQGIYRFDPALYPHIVDTAGVDSIPAGILTRLPEWCVYIETPGVVVPHLDSEEEVPLYGAWVRLEQSNNDGAPFLVISADTDDSDAVVPPTQEVFLHGSVADGIGQSIENAMAAGLPVRCDAGVVRKRISAWVTPVVNLALYLCTSPEYTRRGAIGQPANPVPKKTRRDGWRLFPADGPAEWDVGVRIGAALRAAYQREETGGDAAPDGRNVRPHVRRAHWHGFRSGPRKRADGSDISAEERRFDIRWMPPIPVNIQEIDTLPATIRTIKP